jgi:hypothetical protein
VGAGRRPVLLLSRDDAYYYLNKFVVAEVPTTIRNIAVEVPPGKADRLRRPSPIATTCGRFRGPGSPNGFQRCRRAAWWRRSAL